MEKLLLIILISLSIITTPIYGKSVKSKKNYIEKDEKIDMGYSGDYPDSSAILYSIVPGVILHGSGHYFNGDKNIGLKILLVQGIALGGIGIFGSILLTTGNAGFLAGIVLPGIFFSVSIFLATWLFDIIGTTGLYKIVTKSDPYFSNFSIGYAYQEDYQTDLHNFLNISAQYYTKNDHLFDISFNQEFNGDHYDLNFRYGYPLLSGHNKLHLIPEIKYQSSSEGFSITTTNIHLRYDLNLGCLSPTLKNIYLISGLGYGYQWFHFSGVDYLDDPIFSLLTMKQGIRIKFKTPITLESAILHKKDDIIGGNGIFLTVYEHSLRYDFSNFFIKLNLFHGSGYRGSINIGVK